MIVTWIDTNLVVESDVAVAKTKEGLMSHFDCEDYGELGKYVGQKITCISDDALKSTQLVILQSYTDKFELPNRKFPNLATSGDFLTKCKAKDALGHIQHTKYRSGVSKMIHVMQYSRPQT